MGNLENWKGLASLAGKISARAFEYEQLQFGQRKNMRRAAEIGLLPWVFCRVILHPCVKLSRGCGISASQGNDVPESLSSQGPGNTM